LTHQLKNKLKGRLSQIYQQAARVKIGKKGLTTEMIAEISNQLASHELIKVRFLNNYITDDLDQDIALILKKTNAQKVDKRGKVIILYKPKKE
jgi:putative YhbY family RNA-binding protein